jgi:hypothetical protein
MVTTSRSRLRTYLVLEAGAVALGYLVAVLRDGAPGSGGAWALAVAGGVAVAVPLWVKSRRELRQEAETRSAESLAIETDAKLRLVVGDVVTPIAEVVGKVHQTSGRGERESLRGQLKQLVVEAVASLCDGERARAVFFQLERGEMRAAAWFGRGDPPTTVFTDDPADRRGQEALLLVRFHDYLLVDDVRAEELPEEARAWTAGLLLATDYFANARRDAVAKASAAIRARLHRAEQARSEGRGTSQ